MSSVKWRLFGLGLNELIEMNIFYQGQEAYRCKIGTIWNEDLVSSWLFNWFNSFT